MSFSLQPNVCQHCLHISQSTLLWCSKCCTVCYCSRTCQQHDWSRHKDVCKQITSLPDMVTQVCKGRRSMEWVIDSAQFLHIFNIYMTHRIRNRITGGIYIDINQSAKRQRETGKTSIHYAFVPINKIEGFFSLSKQDVVYRRKYLQQPNTLMVGFCYGQLELNVCLYSVDMTIDELMDMV